MCVRVVVCVCLHTAYICVLVLRGEERVVPDNMLYEKNCIYITADIVIFLRLYLKESAKRYHGNGFYCEKSGK